ncbi:MAG: hypothetical protein D6E12_06750 [Desulfovibrio sp.]|nr:MAG: hypothetical protein D6E12_06750 [Desulfovibrio sp.]
MTTALIETIGLVAGTLTTASFLPQVLKAFRTRQTRDISLLMYSILCTGVSIWLVYGFLINSLAVILANAVTLILVLGVLFLKLRHG